MSWNTHQKRNLNKTQQSNITLYQLQSNYVTKYSIKMKTRKQNKIYYEY